MCQIYNHFVVLNVENLNLNTFVSQQLLIFSAIVLTYAYRHTLTRQNKYKSKTTNIFLWFEQSTHYSYKAECVQYLLYFVLLQIIVVLMFTGGVCVCVFGSTDRLHSFA